MSHKVPSEEGRSDISLRTRIISACAGSVLTSVAVNPFDVVRVRMQQSSAVEHIPSASFASSDAPRERPAAPPRGVTTSLEKTLASSITKNNPAFSSSGEGVAATFSPKQLGINTCCKDVFWYPSTFKYCVAETTDLCAMEPAHAKPQHIRFSTYGLLKKIMHDEGPLVPWRGVPLVLVQAIPSNVTYFIAYERVRDELKPYLGSQCGPLASGGVARTIASTMVSPLELLKTRLQSLHIPAGQSPMAEAVNSIKEMIAIDGYRALWSGLGLTLWRDVPFSSVYWMVVEWTRSTFPAKSLSNLEKLSESVLAGTVGGIAASVVTTPFDVAKTRRQLGHSSCTSAHMSIPRFMTAIVQNEGWRALFVGLAPRTMKVAPACAIMITSYEMGKRLLE